MKFGLGTYKTEGGLTVVLAEHTPNRSFKYVGYFQLRDIRIRIFYTAKGDEYFGEKKLNLKEIVYTDGPYTIKPLFDPKKAREIVLKGTKT